MELRDKIMADVKAAMIAKESLKLTALRGLQAAIKNREIDMRPDPITPEEVMNVVKKLVKQRKESIDQFQQAGRQDLVDQESAELKVLEVYLPTQMSREQIEALVTEVIAATGAKTVKDMGPVMKEVIARANGAADNKIVSEVIKTKLA
ncbi:GatB/YqeY domain-containing protein [Bdellovibrio sp. SKB1291214]|uniref:GatB/YqeY domain-containing protein n=1 Tax=Bdellovibrio sp. SKB1291214 TaxID=1732569 RepID=UPI000B518FF5|nr:GatB/YqeY domain-containing protein [Bdellovibrio sp. SKB1291214]UYL10357.1 GatB/YqeY domain-containing protein [Bdellovibrio sp. SKB1291214]